MIIFYAEVVDDEDKLVYLANQLAQSISNTLCSIIQLITSQIYWFCKDSNEDITSLLFTESVEAGIFVMLWNVLYYRRAKYPILFLDELRQTHGGSVSHYTGYKSCKSKARIICSGVNQVLKDLELQKTLFESNMDTISQISHLEQNLTVINDYHISIRNKVSKNNNRHSYELIDSGYVDSAYSGIFVIQVW